MCPHPLGQIGGGQNCMHTGQSQRRRYVDAPDPSMTVWAPKKTGMQGPRRLYVIDVAAFPGKKRYVFKARDSGAKMFRTH
jgi:hypothetical protein